MVFPCLPHVCPSEQALINGMLTVTVKAYGTPEAVVAGILIFHFHRLRLYFPKIQQPYGFHGKHEAATALDEWHQAGLQPFLRIVCFAAVRAVIDHSLDFLEPFRGQFFNGHYRHLFSCLADDL